jgi:hypothetical protein
MTRLPVRAGRLTKLRIVQTAGLLFQRRSIRDAQSKWRVGAGPVAAASPSSSISLQYRIATGSRTGKPVMRLGDRIEAEVVEFVPGKSCASVQGFSLHAGVAVNAHDRARLERLCRYIARPPIATKRLSELPDGRIAYALRHPWRDGPPPAWQSQRRSLLAAGDRADYGGCPRRSRQPT